MQAIPSPAPPLHLVEDLDQALDEAAERSEQARTTPEPELREPELPARRWVPRELLGMPLVSRLLRFAAEEWLMIAAAWVAIALSPGWAYPFLAFFVAMRLHALGVLLHDATHMDLRGKEPAVRLLELLVGYPIASTLDAMRYHHLRHHKDSGMPTDPYMKPSMRGRPWVALLIWLRHLFLVPWWTLRGPFGLAAVVIPSLRTFYARAFLQDRSGHDLTLHPEVIRCAKEELGQVLFHLSLVCFATIRPDWVIWYYLIPAWVTGLLAGYRVLREHDYAPTKDRSIRTILATTCDHNLTGVGRFVLAPRNIGYHIVHHLHPRVALENLPRLRDYYVARWPETYPSAPRTPR